jgi:hypothetical protein
MPPIEFSIHYSVEDGYEGQALALARRLFAVYDTGIDSLSLAPAGEPGVALYFNGRLIISHQRDGRAPTVADVRALFSQEGITVVQRSESEAGIGAEIRKNDGNIAALTEALPDRKTTP